MPHKLIYDCGLTHRDFPVNARLDSQAAEQAAARLADQFDYILQFAVGDAVEVWLRALGLDDKHLQDAPSGERVARCHDILAVACAW